MQEKITGIIGFIITLVYVCYNGYILNNDIAYGEFDYDSDEYQGGIVKLYPNGATFKKDESQSKYIYIYENDNSDYSKYAKFKDLVGKQYNYDSKYYKAFSSQTVDICQISASTTPTYSTYSDYCEYLYSQVYTSNENKDLYDRWTTTLILGIFIVLCNIGLLIFGFLLFKGGADLNETKTVQIQQNRLFI